MWRSSHTASCWWHCRLVSFSCPSVSSLQLSSSLRPELSFPFLFTPFSFSSFFPPSSFFLFFFFFPSLLNSFQGYSTEESDSPCLAAANYQ